ncbi:hypothetical protein ACLOJK_015835 [Asimina triloba]
MASSGFSKSSSSTSSPPYYSSSSCVYAFLPPSWTLKQNKDFERAIAIFDEGTPERWEKVASMVAGKTPEDVRRHYNRLLHDLKRIECGLIPIPNYEPFITPTNEFSSNDRRSGDEQEDGQNRK